MQTAYDLNCTECSGAFSSASLLLQHFASHAIKHLENQITSLNADIYKKNKVPNLYPINGMYDVNINETDRGSDSGIEDINPLKFCMITMEEKQGLHMKVGRLKKENNNTNKKYQCMYCLRKFGWSTDLKRHILIHTGERPFQCSDCNSSFTRNFLLQKHQKKIHNCERVGRLPELRPISKALLKKRRKQQKYLIKHNTCLDKFESKYGCNGSSVLCSS